MNGSDLSERHEVRVRGEGQSIVFIADSSDGRLVIRQEPEGGEASDVCSLTLSNPDELRAFFMGLRRIVASLGYGSEAAAATDAPGRPAGLPLPAPAAQGSGSRLGSAPSAGGSDGLDRDALVEKARQRNPQAFTPWTREEEDEVRRRHESGESLESIARARKRSPRAIELRLQRLGVLPRSP